jgi:hypothetical protein
MGHVTNTVGAILIILATVTMAGGAGALTYGTMDGEAAEQEFTRNRDRVDQDEQLAAGGAIVLVLGLGLFIIGVVLAARSGKHADEVSRGLVATRKTFGVILMILAILLLIAGIGLFSYGYMAEEGQGNGFNYDSDDGQVFIAMATAGAALLALGVAMLVSGIVMVSKGDKIHRTTEVVDVPAAITEPENLKPGNEEQMSLQGLEEQPNRNALFVLAGIAGFAMLIAVLFLAMYGTGGDGGLFSDSPVYHEQVYNYTMSNTGNAPVIGTLGESWVEEFSTRGQVNLLTLIFHNSGSSSMSYKLEQMIDGTWEEIGGDVSSAADFSLAAGGEFAEGQFRFTVEPNQSFVSSADLGVLVIQQS